MKAMKLLLGVCAVSLVAAAAASAQSKDPPGVNPQHYQCYSVTEPKPSPARKVVLQDQFGAAETATARAVLLCNPVSKNKSEVRDKLTHLVCYEVRPRKFPARRVEVENQFGREALTVTAPRLLCVPSLKKPLG